MALLKAGASHDLTDGAVRMLHDIDQHHAHPGRQLAKPFGRNTADAEFQELSAQPEEIDSVHIRNDTSFLM